MHQRQHRRRVHRLPAALIAVSALWGGCAESGPEAGEVTFARDIAPILRDNCVSCHQEGAIAPFALDTYALAKALGPAMRSATGNRTMPPMNLDNSGDCRTFENAMWLSDEQIALIDQWVTSGMPEGDPSEMPAMTVELEQLEDPEVTLDMGVEYSPSTAANDDYRCFVVDPGLTTDQFMTAYEVAPGNPRVVHHVILFIPSSDEAAADASALDAAEAGPGYTCFGDSGVDAAFAAGWAPGVGVTHNPEGTGIQIPANRPLILQVHYNTINGAAPDRTRMHLRLRSQVEKVAQIIPFIPVASLSDFSPHLELPAGMSEVEAVFEASLLDYARAALENPGLALPPMQLHSVIPHMHTLGRTLRVEVDQGLAEPTCLAQVNNWDFDWQQPYNYAEAPIALDPEQPIRIRCTYDTTSRTETVNWGEGTLDEMCVGFLYLTF